MRRRAAPRRGPGVVGTVARTAVIAGTATAVSRGVSGSMNAKADAAQQAQAAKVQQQADIQSMQQQLESLQVQQTQAAVAPAAPTAAPAAAGPDLIAQLQQLGDLKTAGLLTDAEFEAAKARILGS
jgi:Short C-terminal domain